MVEGAPFHLGNLLSEGYFSFRWQAISLGGDGFFFTSDGALVELAYLAYIQSDQPIPTYVDVPRLSAE